MKHRIFILLVVCAALAIWSCQQNGPLSPRSQESNQSEPGSVPDEGPTPPSKIVVHEFYWDWNLDWDDPFECGGDLWQGHGWIRIHIVEKIMPSGNVIMNGWIDYKAHQGVTIEKLGTGEIWTLISGNNPLGAVEKENGFYIHFYHTNELYRRPNSDDIHNHCKGYFKQLPDGTVTHYRNSCTCG
jgi:hypothetical protein